MSNRAIAARLLTLKALNLVNIEIASISIIRRQDLSFQEVARMFLGDVTWNGFLFPSSRSWFSAVPQVNLKRLRLLGAGIHFVGTDPSSCCVSQAPPYNLMAYLTFDPRFKEEYDERIKTEYSFPMYY